MVRTPRVDFGRIAQAYSRNRPPYPEILLQRLFELGVGVPGQRILDLGTGTGPLAREFAKQSCLVTGLDPSVGLLDEAIREDQEAGADVDYIQATAENTGLPPADFDVVTAAQSWHWFDRGRAGREILRVLKPSGLLTLINFDWLPRPGGIVEATEALVMQHNPAWSGPGGNGLYPQWIDQVDSLGFKDTVAFSFDVKVPFTHEQWRGRARTSAGVAASLDPMAVRRFDEDLREMLETYFPREPIQAMHRVWALVTRRPRGSLRA